MAGSQTGKRPAPQAEHGNWWSDAGNAIDQARQAAEAKGREIYEAALRTGRPIAARTEAELRELGAKALQAGEKYVRQNVAAAKGVAAVVKDPRSAEAQRFIRDTQKQATAYGHGAGDAFTMGLADPASSAIRATIQSKGDLSHWKEDYHNDMEQERRQDAYEAANFGDARFGGQVAGTVGSLLVPGLGVGKAAKLASAPAVRYVAKVGGGLARTTPMIGSERAAITAAGALNGVGSQALSDVATGRHSTLGDYVVAGSVGALQGRMAPRHGAMVTGSVGGAGMSVLQDIVDGREIDPQSATISALAGGAGGYVGDRLGTGWVQSLPINATSSKKVGSPLPTSLGELGETMGNVRTIGRGQRTVDGPDRFQLPSGRYTRPDEYIAPGLFDAPEMLGEQKMEGGRLSRPQQEAMSLLGDRYRLDGFMARDIGTAVGLPVADAASDIARGYDNRVRKRMDVGWDW